MSGLAAAASSAGARGAALRHRICQPFFVAMALLLIATVVLGFSRTLFFRAFFDVPSIPPYLFVHGAVLSLWYVWVLVQAVLVAAHRTEWHGRLGIAGVGIAVCVVVVTLAASLGFVPRMRQLGADFGTEGVRVASTAITSWLVLISFAAFVTLAVIQRRRPEIHKRLMLWASIVLVGAAGSRLSASLVALGLSPSLAHIPATLLLGGPFVYDLIVRGRPHVVTVACCAWQLLMVYATALLAANDTVRAMVLSLG